MLKCGGHTSEEKYCNSLCGGSKSEENEECSSDSYKEQTANTQRNSASYLAFQPL